MALWEVARLGLVAAVAVGTALVALALLASDARRRATRWLAIFLLLVCVNYAAQFAMGLTRVGWIEGVAAVALALDPFALAYFAACFPRRSPRADAIGVTLVVVSGAFAILEATTRAISAPPPDGNLTRLLFFAYLAGCYLYAARAVATAVVTERSSVMASQLQAVLAGVLVVTLTRVALVFDDLRPELAWLWSSVGSSPDQGYMLTSLLVRSAVLGGLLLWAWRAVRATPTGPRREEAARAMRWVTLICAVILGAWTINRALYLADYAGVIDSAAPGWLDLRELSEHSTYAIRWLAFCAAMVIGIVRQQVLAIPLDALAVAVLAVAAAFSSVAIGIAGSLRGPWTAAAVGAIAVAGVAVIARRARGRHHGLAQENYLHQRSLEVYRSRLASALAEGRDPESLDLVSLRERLGVRRSEHEALLAIAQAEERRGELILLGRYRVLRRLGAGSYATVHLVEDTHTRRLLAFKRVLGEGALVDAAMRELEVARRVSHPHLIAIEEVTRVDDGAVVVMEYAEGGSLRDALARDGAMPLARGRTIASQTLQALAALHEAGIVHGDLKPENTLLTLAGEVRVADFGAARAQRGGGTLVESSAAAAGTPRYMAPEVVAGGRATPRSDLYALGIMMGETVREPIPTAWLDWLARLRATDPAQRFASADDALVALPSAIEATARLPRADASLSEVQKT